MSLLETAPAVVTEFNVTAPAPPISFKHNSCQFILFTATGGKVIPFTQKKNGDELIAYKLKNCLFDAE